VAVQVVVGAAEKSGQRSMSVFSRDTGGSAWTCHATGILSSDPVEPAADLSVWPPEGATAVDVTDGYQRLAERGYQYGPAFQGLTALWRRDDEFFAEVALPQAAGGVSGFGVHPVLLDAALHAAAITHEGAGVALPFSWQGVSLHAAGASAVRARIAPSGPSAVSVELADGLGLPVLTVTSMVARPISQQQLMAAISGATGDRLFELAWSPASSASHAETPAYLVFESASAGGDPVAESHEQVHAALAALQSWLTEHESGVLVVSTHGAVGLPREDVTDLGGAAVWGLVRSAQTEHPGRIVLVDSDAPLSDSTIA
jgi:polyketide synthase 12